MRTCSACGGTWFQRADFFQFLREESLGDYWETWPDLVGQASAMPMGIAVCLCGTPQLPNIGGIRGGRTPNQEISRLWESLGWARQSLDGSAVSWGVRQAMAGRESLEVLAGRVKALEKLAGRRLAETDPNRRSPRGRHWAPPTREPVSGGEGKLTRDQLVLKLQERGFGFREAWRVVNALLDAMIEELQVGGKVVIERLLGTFKVVRRPAARRLVRFGREVVPWRVCGAGGTTRGLIDAGGYVIAGIDKDDRCRSTYLGNNKNKTLDRLKPRFLNLDVFPKTSRYAAGGQEELFEQLNELIPAYRCKLRDVPLLFAICAPCQPFTKLSRKELTDERKAGRRRDGSLLGEATLFVAAFEPELVLSENVQGIGDPKYGGVWENFRAELEALGYVTGTKIVCTSRFGIPQYRRRSMLLAARRSVVKPERFADLLGEELLVPENDPDSLMVSVREAIGHLPPIKAGEQHPEIPNHRTRALSELNYLRLSAAKPGESNAYMEDTPDGDLSLDCHKKVNARLGGRCFTDVYTRMAPDRPSPTITTKCHGISNGRFGHYDVKQVRGISLREAAILQSFPTNCVFYPIDQNTAVASMIGNAVPPKLAAFFSGYLAQSVGPKLLKASARR